MGYAARHRHTSAVRLGGLAVEQLTICAAASHRFAADALDVAERLLSAG